MIDELVEEDASATASQFDDEEEAGSRLTQLAVDGALGRLLNVVSSADMSLLVGVGTTVPKGEDVLVPCVEFVLNGSMLSSSAESSKIFSCTITLDNASYMLAHVAIDLSNTCRQLRDLAGAKTRPEPGRLAQTIEYLTTAKVKMEQSLEDLIALARLASDPA